MSPQNMVLRTEIILNARLRHPITCAYVNLLLQASHCLGKRLHGLYKYRALGSHIEPHVSLAARAKHPTVIERQMGLIYK